MKKIILLLLTFSLIFTSCSENYSNGNRVGYLAKFSQKGVIFKTWEGDLNVSQTGYNGTSNDFEFSIDANNPPDGLVDSLNYALNNGNKIKLTYHQVWGFKNMLFQRGSTDYFITKCKIIKSPIK